jgi:uncharacterized protein YkwD
MSDYDTEITSLGPQRHRVAVTQLVNQEREKHGLKPLLPSRQLVVSARVWSVVQKRNDGVLSHGNFATRALRFPFVIAGKPARRRTVGENLAFGTGPLSTPREIVKDWMHSPGHRANILKPWQFGAVWSSKTGGDGVTVVHHFGRNNK